MSGREGIMEDKIISTKILFAIERCHFFWYICELPLSQMRFLSQTVLNHDQMYINEIRTVGPNKATKHLQKKKNKQKK